MTVYFDRTYFDCNWFQCAPISSRVIPSAPAQLPALPKRFSQEFNIRATIIRLLNQEFDITASIVRKFETARFNSINLLKDHACEKAVLVDFSQQAIEIAKDYTKNYRVEIIHADIFNLDLKKKFDFVFSIGLIEHFVEDRRNEAVKIHRQFTKNDGLIMIIVPKKTFFSYILKFFNQVQGYQEEFFSDQEIEGLFKKNGLDIVKKSEMLFGIASCYLLRCQVGLKSSVNC